jgi:hypothetical protein
VIPRSVEAIAVEALAQRTTNQNS